jgi:uncharacterized protein
VQVTHEVAVDVAVPRLWDLLWDVPRMVACVPGCAEAREVEAHRRYTARMTQKVGPIRLSVPLEVTVLEAVPPSRLVLEAKGRDPAVGAEVSMRLTLDLVPDAGASLLRVDATGRVLGKLGGLAHGVIQRKAEESIKEFGERLRVAARSPGEPGQGS